jgi:cystathionine gamma-synthase
MDDTAGFETRAIHAGQPPDAATGAVVPAIHLATTYAQESVGVHRGFEYSRTGNPTRATLEAALASLESARHGIAFSSGMAASDALLRRLRPGEHVVMPSDAYGGTYRLVARVLSQAGVEFTPVDVTEASSVAGAWRPETRLVWVESPSNPLLGIADLAEIARIAHERGGVCVVDNTFATPYLQQPLSLGADAAVHSSTKYLGGHSDVVGGFVATNDDELAAELRFLGIRTLAVRLDRQCESARAVAELLASHPAVSRVYYPGLESHPGHELAARQMRGFGAMVSFVMRDGEQAALDVVARTEVFTLAESLGAVESLIEHPARMTHASVAGSPLAVDPGLVRLSVGLETLDDLLSDLKRALG